MRLERLVALYGASLMDLAAPHPANERIIRASEQERLAFPEAHAAIYLLAPDTKRSMMPILTIYEPGGGTVEPFRTESEEFIHILHGAVEITFAALATRARRSARRRPLRGCGVRPSPRP
jgi:hypothetical protein